MEFYEWVYSGAGPEVPNDDVINDDAMLDEYVENWKRRMKEKHNSGSANKGERKTFQVG